jgi:RNA-directed DNA polymerase
VHHKTRVFDVDLHAYFDNIRHHQVLAKVARRVNDAQVRVVPASLLDFRIDL